MSIMNGIPVIRIQLVHIQGPLKGQIQEFAQASITIGRHPSCSVQFPTETATISRKHAEIVRVDNRHKIVDYSTNGTFVNGKRVTEAFLKDGDVIMFTEGGPKVSYLATITDEVMPVEQVQPASPAAEEKPAPAPEQPVSRPESERKPAPRPEQPVSRPAPPAPPKPVQPQRQSVQKVAAPLIVQYGPQLHSYKELPVTIGKRPDSDFVLSHPSIADQHAQIFFSQGMYWVRDLGSSGSITINGSPVSFEEPLKPQDVLRLAPDGPSFCFLGEGRLAEHEEPTEEEPSVSRHAPASPAVEKKGKSFFRDLFKK